MEAPSQPKSTSHASQPPATNDWLKMDVPFKDKTYQVTSPFLITFHARLNIPNSNLAELCLKYDSLKNVQTRPDKCKYYFCYLKMANL